MTRESGFSMIELLIVISIIGILAAMAVPQFREYRLRAYDARAKTDLHNVATAEEAYYVDHERYVACDQTDCHTLLPSIRGLPSLSVLLQITVSSATATEFTGTARHPSSTNTFTWDSGNGGLQP